MESKQFITAREVKKIIGLRLYSTIECNNDNNIIMVYKASLHPIENSIHP